MGHAIFTQRVDSTYDDLPEERYHFPKTYLRQASQAVDSWIVYYQPRRGTPANSLVPASHYYAVARLVGIDPDPEDPRLFYARVRDYLEFDRPVSFRREEASYEPGLLKSDGSVNKGLFGRSVRALSDDAFNAILEAGFSFGLQAWELAEDTPLHIDRPVVERLTKRPYRDRRFRQQVVAAYGNTCAVTRLSLINGGGRPEVQAAHIIPVEHSGPDSVRNGLALSGTAHWMFDRGLFTIDRDLRLVLSQALAAEMHQGWLRHGSELHVPAAEFQRPNERFLEYHRTHIFHD